MPTYSTYIRSGARLGLPTHSSFRLVALTSHLMDYLRSTVSSAMDPLQFAYRLGIGVQDSVISLLHRSLSHLEKPGSAERIVFFHLSSAFNTIQPLLLRDKLETAGVDYDLAERNVTTSQTNPSL